MNQIQIANVTISQTESLFSLNDLHRASGGQKKHEPHQWFRNAQTQDLIAEIEAQGKQAVQTVNGGKNRGTYVCRELVVSYGMWISAAFALQVIQVFLAAQEPSGSLKLSPAQKQQIQQAVMARHHRTGEHWQEIYRKLHSFCQVNSYHEIPAADFDRALGYLNSIQDAPEVFRQPQAARFEDHEVARLATVVYYCNWACRLLEEVSAPLKALGYGKALTMWTIADESISFIRGSREALERELPNIADSYYRNHIQHSLRRFDAVQTI